MLPEPIALAECIKLPLASLDLCAACLGSIVSILDLAVCFGPKSISKEVRTCSADFGAASGPSVFLPSLPS
jgi:hypothetical protein